MAASPRWKVYSPAGEYVAACRYVEDAASIITLHGDGATIRDGHCKADTVWTEGAERQPASESIDFVAGTVLNRANARRKASA